MLYKDCISYNGSQNRKYDIDLALSFNKNILLPIEIRWKIRIAVIHLMYIRSLQLVHKLHQHSCRIMRKIL